MYRDTKVVENNLCFFELQRVFRNLNLPSWVLSITGRRLGKADACKQTWQNLGSLSHVFILLVQYRKFCWCNSHCRISIILPCFLVGGEV